MKKEGCHEIKLQRGKKEGRGSQESTRGKRRGITRGVRVLIWISAGLLHGKTGALGLQ